MVLTQYLPAQYLSVYLNVHDYLTLLYLNYYVATYLTVSAEAASFRTFPTHSSHSLASEVL